MSGEHVCLTVGSAPHWRSRSSITRMNFTFVAALLPTAIAGAVAHAFGPRNVEVNAALGGIKPLVETLLKEMGVHAGVLWLFGILGTVVLGMGVGLLAEYGCQVVMRQPYHATNGHGALMGLLVTLLCPPEVSAWILAFGVFLTVFVGKQIYGGIGAYPMHPAMIGWLILLLSWPHELFPLGASSIGAANPIVVFFTVLGGIALCLSGYIRWQIPLGVLAGVALSSVLFSGPLAGSFFEQFTSGHVVLAAFFIATDSTVSPANRLASWLYGGLVGFLIILIRAYGAWPDAVPFAILLSNVANPLLDRIRPCVRRVVA